MKELMYRSVLFCFVLFSIELYAQQTNLPFTHSGYAVWETNMYRPGANMHTGIRPFLANDVYTRLPGGSMDSINRSFFINPDKSRSWFMRKLRHEHLIQAKGEDYTIEADLVIDFGFGQDRVAGENLSVNSRGVNVRGDLGSKFSFNTTYWESQASFPGYIDSFIKYNRVVPGQGMVRPFKGQSYDFAHATGYIAYSPNRFFDIQFGHDRNFIGDGYRSLLISDNQFPYPFLRVLTTVGPFRYMNLYTSMMDMRAGVQRDEGFPKKFVNMHYISTRIGKRWNLGIFESITWGGVNRGLDFNYMNPIILYHPIAFADQSSANILMGLNVRYVPMKDMVLYGQFMLDEFRINDVRTRNGWWGNKQGLQGGFKYFNVAGIENLMIQSELNYIRPYTYQYHGTFANYEHYNQPIAHPIGANFYESTNFLRYRYRMWGVEMNYQYLVYGDDADQINNGRRVNNSYLTNRPREYGIRTTDGILNVIHQVGMKLQYTINPRSLLGFEAGVMRRVHTVQAQAHTQTTWIFAGIRTNLFNKYYDF